MLDELSERYGDLLTGSYGCVDRIVLDAYFPPGHNPGLPHDKEQQKLEIDMNQPVLALRRRLTTRKTEFFTSRTASSWATDTS